MKTTTVAYAPKENLPLMMLALEMMLLVKVVGVLKDNVPHNAQILKFGPIVHALIVLETRYPMMLELPAYAREETMLKMMIVLAKIKNSPMIQSLTNKPVVYHAQMTLLGPNLMVLQPVFVLTATVVPKNITIHLVVLVLLAPLTLHAMDLTLLVVLIPSTSNNPIDHVMLLVKMERNGEMMHANVPLLKKMMEMVVLTVPEQIKRLIMIKMLAYANLGMNLPQVMVTHMVANSNPTQTNQLLIIEPI